MDFIEDIPKGDKGNVASFQILCRGSAHRQVLLYLNTVLLYGRGKRHEVASSADSLEFYAIKFDDSIKPLCFVRDRGSFNRAYVNGHLVGSPGRITPGWCLVDGDIIDLYEQPDPGANDASQADMPRTNKPHMTVTFRQSKPLEVRFPNYDIQLKEKRSFATRYDVTDRCLGGGANAVVHLATEKATNKQVACRIVNLSLLKLKPDSRKILKRLGQEVDTMRQLHHPNIISYVHAIQSPRTLYCFTELASGGDLFSFVERRMTCGSPLTDGDVKMIMAQIVNGVEYLHRMGVVHRDLKPENVLFAVYPSPDYRLVLCDLGHSAVKNHRRLKSVVGTQRYIAPEMVNNGEQSEHGFPVDIWAVGLIMLFLINSQVPLGSYGMNSDWHRMDQQHIDRLISFNVIDSRMNLPVEGENFVKSCVKIQPTERMTAKQARDHVWFRADEHQSRLRALRTCMNASWNVPKRVFPMVEKIPDVLAGDASTLKPKKASGDTGICTTSLPPKNSKTSISLKKDLGLIMAQTKATNHKKMSAVENMVRIKTPEPLMGIPKEHHQVHAPVVNPGLKSPRELKRPVVSGGSDRKRKLAVISGNAPGNPLVIDDTDIEHRGPALSIHSPVLASDTAVSRNVATNHQAKQGKERPRLIIKTTHHGTGEKQRG